MHTEPVEAPPPSAPVSRTREWRAVLVIWLLAVAIWIPYWWLARPIALQDPDTQDYAQIGLNLAQGKGMVTSIMPLGGLEWMRQTGRLDQPWWNLHRFPLPCLIDALFIRMFGARDLSISLASAVFFFATIPLVFLFARRLFPYPVAILATFLFTFNGGQMADSITGLTEPAATFFFLCALYLVLWPRQWWSLPLAGALTGLAFLNRYSVVLYGVPMLWLIWRRHRHRPLASVAVFIGAGALVSVWWLLRNYWLTGNPMFSLTTALMVRYMTAASPRAHDWYQFVYEQPGHFWRMHPLWTLKKWAIQTGNMWWNSTDDIGETGYVLPFFLVSILQPSTGDRQLLRRWLFWVFTIHFITLGLLSNIPRYYAIFAPFLFMYAASVMVWLWDMLKPSVRRRHVAFGVFLAFPVFFNWAYIAGTPRKPREDRTWVEYTPHNQDWLRANTPAGALIVSDVPWSVAWYGRRRSLPLPPSPAEMARFPHYGVQPDGIYLKAPRKRMNVPDGWDQWRSVQFARLPVAGYRLAHVFPDHAAYYQRVR